jgi:parallel beta-helix repeat protein
MLKKTWSKFLLIAVCLSFAGFGAFFAPVSQMQTSTLISENFSVSASNFTVVRGGTWTVTSGTYRLTNPDNSLSIGNGNISVHNTNVTGDFVLTADASVVSTTNAFNDFSILFDYQDTDNYYFASYNESNDPNTSGIFKVSGGTQTQLADITTLITPGTTYAVKVERIGGTLNVYRNNTLLATANDSTFTSGKVGFGSRNDTCTFDNLIVTQSASTPTPTPTITPTPTPGDGIPAPLRTVNVSSVSTLQTAINNAIPGDHIVLANGNYTLSASVAVNGENGTAANPIVIRAASILGVTFNGTGAFNITGSSYIIVQGFRFVGSTDSGGASGLNIKDSNFCRVTRNYFQMSDSTKAYWTFISGSGNDHRIDHNEYANKPSEGCFIVVYGTTSPYNMSLRVRIDHNYLHHQTFSGANGGETIRFGDSNRQNIDAFGIIESNLFESNTGDVEVVSVKSSSNNIRYNTLRGNVGSIVLRHGDDNTVEGNFLLDGQNGVRFYGDNHKIIGNYFSGDSGSGVRSTLGIGNGNIADAPGGNTGYDQPNNNIIAFNTFVANSTNVVFGLEGSSSFPPVGTVFANNILQGDTGTLVSVSSGTPSGTIWQGNILWGAASAGIIPASGYTRVNPLLSLGTYSVYRIASNSPAINAAVNSSNYNYLTTDLDGQTRVEPKDVGADEYSTGAIVRFPLSNVDVGPNAP